MRCIPETAIPRLPAPVVVPDSGARSDAVMPSHHALGRGFTDADLEQNARDYDIKGKGPMPYPSLGTACAVFGRVRALGGAINDRKSLP